MKLIPLFIILLLLPGCLTTYYYHPDKGASDFERDRYDCYIMATQHAANWGSKGNPLIIASHQDQCLRMKHGWRKAQR